MPQNARRATFWVWVGENLPWEASRGLEAIYGAAGEEGCQPSTSGYPDSGFWDWGARSRGVALAAAEAW